VPNPASDLAHLLATFHDDKGRVTIPGFYDKVASLSPDEKAQIAKLPYTDQEFLAEVGSPETYGETGFSTIERRWARPTFEVNGIYGGYMGAGSSTIVPSRAGAKMSMRLVANQSAAENDKAFEAAVRHPRPSPLTLASQSRFTRHARSEAGRRAGLRQSAGPHPRGRDAPHPPDVQQGSWSRLPDAGLLTSHVQRSFSQRVFSPQRLRSRHAVHRGPLRAP